MKFLAEFALSGRFQAVAVVLLLGLLGLTVPPLIILSGGLLALISLRQNSAEALLVFAATVTVSLVFAWASGRAVYLAAVVLAVFWGSVVLSAVVTRITARLSYAVLSALLSGILLVLLVYGVSADPVAYWGKVLLKLPDLQMLQKTLALSDTELKTQFGYIARVLTGVIAAGLFVSTMLALFLGRWLQARLYNPGGFQGEFHALRLGPLLAGAVLAAITVALITGSAFWTSIAIVCAMAFLFQGLAVVHCLASAKNWHVGWLVLLYLLLLISPAMLLLIVLLGLFDVWIDLRTRASMV